MAGYKQARRVRTYFRLHPRIIVAGVTSDMGHPDIQALPDVPLVSGEAGSDLTAIYVSMYGHHGSNAIKFYNNRIITYIAGMPDLIAHPQMCGDPGIKKTMGIR
jgi:hypothetical protein